MTNQKLLSIDGFLFFPLNDGWYVRPEEDELKGIHYGCLRAFIHKNGEEEYFLDGVESLQSYIDVPLLKKLQKAVASAKRTLLH